MLIFKDIFFSTEVMYGCEIIKRGCVLATYDTRRILSVYSDDSINNQSIQSYDIYW